MYAGWHIESKYTCMFRKGRLIVLKYYVYPIITSASIYVYKLWVCIVFYNFCLMNL